MGVRVPPSAFSFFLDGSHLCATGPVRCARFSYSRFSYARCLPVLTESIYAESIYTESIYTESIYTESIYAEPHYTEPTVPLLSPVKFYSREIDSSPEFNSPVPAGPRRANQEETRSIAELAALLSRHRSHQTDRRSCGCPR